MVQSRNTLKNPGTIFLISMLVLGGTNVIVFNC